MQRVVILATRIQHNFDGFLIGESRQNFRAEITLQFDIYACFYRAL